MKYESGSITLNGKQYSAVKYTYEELEYTSGTITLDKNKATESTYSSIEVNIKE